MNPSVHFDGGTWRCVIRCANYAMPGGTAIRANQGSVYTVSKNAMLILDPDTLRPTKVYRMPERDGYPRVPSSVMAGYADMRLFMTELNGRYQIYGIAAASHLGRLDQLPSIASKQHSVEQVIVTLDQSTYEIMEAMPLRGAWSSAHQKNWSPFDGFKDPRLVVNIDRGRIHNELGPVTENETATMSTRPLRTEATGGAQVQKRSYVTYRGLRGGTQLVYVGDRLGELLGRHVEGGAWISLAHDVRYLSSGKFYWHVLYAIDVRGNMLAMSRPFKLDIAHGIEFAAGLAIDHVEDGPRAVISYGVDDIECKLGVTSLEALLGLLEPVAVVR